MLLALLAALITSPVTRIPAPIHVTYRHRPTTWILEFGERTIQIGEDIKVTKDITIHRFMWLDHHGNWHSGYSTSVRF